MNDVLFVVLLIIDIIERYMLARHIDALNRELDGKPENPMPSVKTFGRQFALAVKRVRMKNMGEIKPVPDVHPELERKLAAHILTMVEYDFTEEGLFPKWQEIGGGNKKRLRKLLDRWESEGVLRRKNISAKNSTRVLASYIKLKGKAKQ